MESRVRAPKDTTGLLPPPKVDHFKVVQEITELKVRREKVLRSLSFQRSRIRFPVTEATYMANWEIVQRIYERRLLHVNFCNTWIYPAAPFPFRRNLTHQYEHEKIGFRDVCLHGMSDLSAGIYTPEVGWVGPSDPREPYGEMQRVIDEILEDMQKKRDVYLAGRYRIRLLAMEKKNQREGEVEMLEAILAANFRRCMYLVQRRGVSIDLETKEGYTILLAASEENVNSMNHVKMKNDDGRECLAVEYLLDREIYRPSIELESTVSGHTALIRACILSRAHVVEALLDRGANINYVNRFGKTALHYTAAAGDPICTRILIERFADKNIKDVNGLTPYEIADNENFVDVMKLLSQFQGGFLGPVQVSRGRVNNFIKCVIGCGMNIFPFELDKHAEVCEWRPASCPNSCGDSRLSFKEIPDHVELHCIRRVIYCQDCHQKLQFRYLEKHLENLCSHRLVPCDFGCGLNVQFCDLEKHQQHCSWQISSCPLFCPVQIKSKDIQYHIQEECENRRVTCPLKCRGLVVAKLLAVHMSTICNNRQVECQFCQKLCSKNNLDHHEKDCIFRTIACPDKCGDIIRFCDVHVHTKKLCDNRFVECPLKCNLKVRASNLEYHQNKECAERYVDCENKCIVDEFVPISERQIRKIVSKLMALHLKFDCSERFNRCSLCLEGVKAKDVTNHDKDECKGRKVHCTTPGCLKELPLSELDHHVKYSCRFRLVTCKQSCGELIPSIHLGIHMRGACEMRIMPCTLNCGLKIRYTDLNMHLENECSRRFTMNNNNYNIDKVYSHKSNNNNNNDRGSSRGMKSIKDKDHENDLVP